MCKGFFKLLSQRIFTSFIVIFGFIFFISSCEGMRCAEGTIYDADTKELIDSVLCTVKSGNEVQYSDSLGKYSVCNPFGGCVPDCRDITVEFTKTGYKTKTLTNPKFNSDVYLEKE